MRNNKIKENVTLDELNEKVNLILDALGLTEEDFKSVKKDEEEIITDSIEIDDSSLEDTDIVDEEVKEDLNNFNNVKYRIIVNDTEAYLDDANKLTPYFTDYNSIDFDSLDDLISFLKEQRVITDKGIDSLISKDKLKDRGLIYLTSWYDVVKGV